MYLSERLNKQLNRLKENKPIKEPKDPNRYRIINQYIKTLENKYSFIPGFDDWDFNPEEDYRNWSRKNPDGSQYRLNLLDDQGREDVLEFIHSNSKGYDISRFEEPIKSPGAIQMAFRKILKYVEKNN